MKQKLSNTDAVTTGALLFCWRSSFQCTQCAIPRSPFRLPVLRHSWLPIIKVKAIIWMLTMNWRLQFDAYLWEITHTRKTVYLKCSVRSDWFAAITTVTSLVVLQDVPFFPCHGKQMFCLDFDVSLPRVAHFWALCILEMKGEKELRIPNNGILKLKFGSYFDSQLRFPHCLNWS